jgi:hypothetical protein
MMSATDLPDRQSYSSQALQAFSRYRERKLVSQLWQHVRTHDCGQFLGFCDCHIQSPSSPHAASVHCALYAEVAF